jgi:hypothetical protein
LTSFGLKGYRAIQDEDWWPFKYEKNCYEMEEWKEGKILWCNNDASLKGPLSVPVSLEIIRLSFSVHNPDIQANLVTVGYGGKRGPIYELTLTDGSWKKQSEFLP